MVAIAVYDANVLYPNTLRDLLIRVARAGLVKARWSDQILDETFVALRRQRQDISEEKVKRLRVLMNDAVRDCLVSGHEGLIPSLSLPDEGDRHVLAAAMTTSAQVIVTWNIRDFPAEALAPHGIRAQTPDDFTAELIAVARPVV